MEETGCTHPRYPCYRKTEFLPSALYLPPPKEVQLCLVLKAQVFTVAQALSFRLLWLSPLSQSWDYLALKGDL